VMSILIGVLIGLSWIWPATKLANMHCTAKESPWGHFGWYCVYAVPGVLLTCVVMEWLTFGAPTV
jgi:hypothetical protein